VSRACAAVIAVALAFALGRFALTFPHHPFSVAGTYEALAHLFVGGLFGAALAARKWWPLWVALGLTGVEALAFVTGRAR
jgi:hypothetical protein